MSSHHAHREAQPLDPLDLPDRIRRGEPLSDQERAAVAHLVAAALEVSLCDRQVRPERTAASLTRLIHQRRREAGLS